jgi:phosphoglycolate phosphatase
LADLAGVTVVFDLDGTLADTAPDLMAALNAVLAGEDLPPASLQSTRAMIGGGLRALLARALHARGVDPGEGRFEDLCVDLRARYRARIARESRPYPGVAAALEAIAAAGARLAVCTNKPSALAAALLGELGLARHFAAVVGPDGAPAAKPDPRHLLFAIEQAGGERKRAIMVGDSASDARAARAAGLPLILVDFGYADAPLAELGADVLISHFDQLPAACAALSGRPRAPCEGAGQPL